MQAPVTAENRQPVRKKTLISARSRIRWRVSVGTASRRATRSASLAIAPDRDLPALELAGAQSGNHALRRRLGDLHEREPVGDLDGADLAAGDPGLAGDGADQVLGPDPGVHPGADIEPGIAAIPAAAADRAPPGPETIPRAGAARTPRIAPASLLAGRPLARRRRLGDLLGLLDLRPVGPVGQLHGRHRHLHHVELVG